MKDVQKVNEELGKMRERKDKACDRNKQLELWLDEKDEEIQGLQKAVYE